MIRQLSVLQNEQRFQGAKGTENVGAPDEVCSAQKPAAAQNNLYRLYDRNLIPLRSMLWLDDVTRKKS